MANLPQSSVWEAGIYQLEETDPVQGGANGIDNLQGKQLANRTLYLKGLVDSLGTDKLALSSLASQVEAIAGTDNTKWMTPLRVAQAIVALATIAAASETVAGKVELATVAETITGTDTVRATHPAGVKAAISAAVAAASETVAGNVELATVAETITGTDTVRATHPAGVKAAISAAVAAASETVAGKVELATVAETITGTDTVRATHPAGVKAAIETAISTLVNSSPATLNTLSELATALGNDPNFATSISNIIASKQPLDGTLTALSGLTTSANQFPYSTGLDTFSMAALTAFGRSLIDDADASAARNTLGLGDLSTKNTSSEFGSSLAESGYQKLPSGLIIQWGYTSILANLAAGIQSVSLTLPISFTTSLLNAFVSVTNDGGTGGSRIEARWNKVGSSLTQVAMHYEEIAAVTQDNYRLSYLAIGY